MRFLMVCILVLTFAFNTAAQNLTNTNSANLPNRTATSEVSEYNKIRLIGFDALYNMDYSTARAKFTQMTELSPENPAGHFYLATNYWLELLNSSRRLQANLYSGDSFYAETEEKVDEKVDKEFRRLVQVALQKTETQLKSNPKDIEALYYKGAAHGLLASYEATVTRSFFSALRNGSKSVDIHRKLVEVSPNYFDAYLTIGMYDYVVGSLPLTAKVIGTIFGFRGSRERGLGELNLVSKRGIYAADDAKVLLVALYAREKKYSEMINLLDTLADKYPQNYLFKVEKAVTLVKLNRAKESFQLFEELLKNKNAQKIADLVHYQYAEALTNQGNNSEALEHLQMVKTVNVASKELVTRAYLRAGQVLDLMSKRSEAVSEYQAVLKRENVFDSHDKAKKYFNKPYSVRN
jgi:tetratricopeptide (TPR) repeat protein